MQEHLASRPGKNRHRFSPLSRVTTPELPAGRTPELKQRPPRPSGVGGSRPVARGRAGLFRRQGMRGVPAAAGREEGASLLEFALALPLLVLVVAGIWDFGSTFALKDKMTNAAREAARVAVSSSVLPPLGSTATCTSTAATPCTIVAAISALRNYMDDEGVNLDSCVAPNTPSSSGPDPEEYTYTCASMPGLKIVINRSATVAQTTSTGTEQLPATTVSFSYPVGWWFSPFGWLSPPSPSTLTTSVSMANLVY